MSEEKISNLEQYANHVAKKCYEEQRKISEEGLRDSFAGSALNALILANEGCDTACTGLGICLDAYNIADNMIEARIKSAAELPKE